MERLKIEHRMREMNVSKENFRFRSSVSSLLRFENRKRKRNRNLLIGFMIIFISRVHSAILTHRFRIECFEICQINDEIFCIFTFRLSSRPIQSFRTLLPFIELSIEFREKEKIKKCLFQFSCKCAINRSFMCGCFRSYYSNG